MCIHILTQMLPLNALCLFNFNLQYKIMLRHKFPHSVTIQSGQTLVPFNSLIFSTKEDIMSQLGANKKIIIATFFPKNKDKNAV